MIQAHSLLIQIRKTLKDPELNEAAVCAENRSGTD